MKRKVCFFIGHRDAPESIYPVLLAAVERHIAEYGVSCFVVGQYGNFDRLARRALKEAKSKYPHIEIVALMPYLPSAQNKACPCDYDDSIYPEGLESVPRRYAIVRANRYMIDHSDYLICYVTHPASNAYNILEYALRRAQDEKITVTNIADC